MKLSKIVTGLAALAATCGWSEASWARGPSEGSLSVGVERLYGITYTSQNAKAPGGDVRTSALNYSFFSNPAGSQRTVYSAPRLALDYLITDQWSAGLGLGIVGGSTNTQSEAADVDGPSIFGLLLAPRAGYMIGLTNWLGFWPKAGFTYTRAVATTGGAQVAQYRGALSVEAGLFVLPAEHVTIGFVPTFDWGLLGSNSAGGEDVRTTALEAGVQGSLGVYF